MLKLARDGLTIRPLHTGIIVRWIANADYATQLLPRPLEPADDTAEIAMFINETIIAGLTDADIDAVEPSEARFNEALFVIPCTYRGEPKAFHYLQYITSEHAAYASILTGLCTKLASIRLMLPFPPEPLHSGPVPGMKMKGTVSRLDDRIITVTFEARHAIDPGVVSTFETPLLGMRYFPDFARGARGKPLVHDLVEMDLAEIQIAEAWSGDATIVFGHSEKEELYHLAPLRMLESYYINGFSYENRGLRMLHDYRGAAASE
jgi:hypothetical protein